MTDTLAVSDRITVIIPTLNEAQGIGPTIEEIKTALGSPMIIVTDACSSDGTPRIAQSLGVKVLTERERGKGRQIASALECVPRDTEWLVLVDGDNTMPAVYLPLMIALLKRTRSAAMVTGNRMFYRRKAFWSDFRSGRTSFGRRFSRVNLLRHAFLSLLHRILNGVDMEDPTSGMRVIRYRHVKGFQPMAKGFDIEVEINCFIRNKTGLTVIEFPVHRLYWARRRLGQIKSGILMYATLIQRMLIVALGRVFA